MCVYSPGRLGKTPIGDAGLGIITDGLKANPECGIRRLGFVSFSIIVTTSHSCLSLVPRLPRPPRRKTSCGLSYKGVSSIGVIEALIAQFIREI